MVIRLASPADQTAVSTIVNDAYSIYVPRIGRKPEPMTSDHGAAIAAGSVWVAVDDKNLPLGVLVVVPRPPSLLLENIAVAPRAQRKGIGRALIEHAEELCSQMEFVEVSLYTNAKMTENIHLYQSLGYVEVGRRQHHGFDRVFFTKRLTS